MFVQIPSGQNEEEKLRRKLSELAGNLSDKGLSSDDEPGRRPFPKGVASAKGGPSITLDSLKDKELSSSSDEMPTQAQKVGKIGTLCLSLNVPSTSAVPVSASTSFLKQFLENADQSRVCRDILHPEPAVARSPGRVR